MFLKAKTIFYLIFFMLLQLHATAQNYRYYKAQMHCHTINSDGSLSPNQVVYQYKNRGYEVLFITDHNVMTDAEFMSEPTFLCINSEEISFQKHINGFFIKHTIAPDNMSPQIAIDSIKAHNGLAQFNHPIKTLVGHDWSYTALEFLALHDLDLIEIYNFGTESTFAPFNHQVWDSVLTAGKIIWGTATDDMHDLSTIGVQSIDRGWVMLWLCELNRDSVFNALKNGRFYSSTGVEIQDYYISGDTINISCSNCNKIIFRGNHGSIRKIANGTSAQYIREFDDYIRVELEGNGGLGSNIYAWTQPYFFNLPNSAGQFKGNDMAEVVLYPNPANEDCLNVLNNMGFDGEIKIDIYDLTGKMLLSANSRNSINIRNGFKVNISELEKGYYLIKVSSKKSSKSLPFIKL